MLRQADIEAIRERAPFSEMSPANFERLVEASYLQRFPAGTFLIEEGDSAEMLHILLDGTVDLFARFKDREATMTLMRPVRGFILAAVVHDLPYLMSARTLTPSRILMIPASVTQTLLAEDRAFNESIMRELAKEFRRTLKALKSHKLRDGTERIAAYLLELRDGAGHADSVELPADRRTLAGYLGMTRENLSRSLQKVRDQGATVQGNTVRFHDPAKLAAFAGLSPLIDNLEAAPEAPTPRDDPSWVVTPAERKKEES